jgi:ABC-type Mn2+/Zn2+ transport system ATPase subunit
MNPLDSQPLITVRDATFGYNQQPVLQNVSLTIDPGEFMGLIGPNGAGKSTLFKGLLKLLPPMSGEVLHAPEIHQRIGYVPQKDRLDSMYPFTASDIVRLGATSGLPWYAGPIAPVQTVWIQECLKRVGMADVHDLSFAELSGGQRQRVLIARALAVRPRLLVLDEPMTGVDAASEDGLLQLLKELHQEEKMTILMISHHARTLRGRATQIIGVSPQRLVIGSPDDLLRPEKMEELA